MVGKMQKAESPLRVSPLLRPRLLKRLCQTAQPPEVPNPMQQQSGLLCLTILLPETQTAPVGPPPKHPVGIPPTPDVRVETLTSLRFQTMAPLVTC